MKASVKFPPVLALLAVGLATRDRGATTPQGVGRTALGWLLAALAVAGAAAASRLLPQRQPAAQTPDPVVAVRIAGAGASAASPADYGIAAWRQILLRVWNGNDEHNLGLLAAGVAFYAFLSFVPLLAALVMSYGLFADPASVSRHMTTIIDLVPADAARLIHEQLVALTTAAAGRKGLGLLVALAIAIYGATRASDAVIAALNVIYGQRNRRGLVRTTLTATLLILGAVATGIVGVLAATMISFAEHLLAGFGPVTIVLLQLLTWLVAGGLCCVAITALYRFAPDRKHARWRWLSVGSVTATLLWLAATLGLGVYADNFAGYGATYGSLAAVVVLLMWLYVSAHALLIGGLINAEAERQTALDSTTGPPLPIGQRGATVADMSAALDDAPEPSGAPA